MKMSGYFYHGLYNTIVYFVQYIKNVLALQTFHITKKACRHNGIMFCEKVIAAVSGL